MSSPLDQLLAVAAAVPGVARVESDHRAADLPALRAHLLSEADVTQVALALGRLLTSAGDPPGAPSQRRHDDTLPRPRSRSRPRIVRVDVHTDGAAFTAEVELSCATRSSRGSARSAVTTSGTRRAVAAATLRALAGLLVTPLHLELECVELDESGGEPVAVVRLSLVTEEGVQQLVGAAVVRADDSNAVVRAALDAVNRRVEPLVDCSG